MRTNIRTIVTAICAVALTTGAAQAQESLLARSDREAEEKSEKERRDRERRARAMLGEYREAGSRIAGTSVSGAPFSAEVVTENTQKLEDGTQIQRTRRTRIYRDGEGRTREDFLRTQGEDRGLTPSLVVANAVISDPEARIYYYLDVRRKAFEQTSGPWPEPEGEGHADRKDARSKEEADRRREGEEDNPSVYLGKRTIEGVEVAGTQRTRVIEAGRIGNDREIRIVSERWFSPELQIEVLTKDSDPRRGTRTYRLTNIQRFEPLPALFVPPPDYKSNADDEDRER